MKQTLFLSLLLSLAVLWWCISQNSDTMMDDSMPVSAEHCAMMPDMSWCEKHMNASGTMSSMMWSHNHADMVNSEFDFVSLMIPHHQEAVDTSRTINAKTSDENLKKLTQDIIDAQKKEITMMQWWLATWYSGQTYTGMPYMPMMRASRAMLFWSLEEEERVWIEDMIVHHQWAIDMAQKLLSLMKNQQFDKPTSPQMQAYRDQLTSFANAIITTQGQEIEQMKEMLKK